MKTQKRVKGVKRAIPASLEGGGDKSKSRNAVEVTQAGPTPPEIVFLEAKEEPDRRLLEEYADSISVLRDEKRFTFREIAVWLQEHGIQCDHNSVYREYTKGMSEQEERDVAIRDAEEENEPQ
jgi:hypothetical protein